MWKFRSGRLVDRREELIDRAGLSQHGSRAGRGRGIGQNAQRLARPDDDRRQPLAEIAHALDHRLPARHAEIEIEQQHVVARFEHGTDAALARRNAPYFVTAEPERIADEPAEDMIILHHENAHLAFDLDVADMRTITGDRE